MSISQTPKNLKELIIESKYETLGELAADLGVTVRAVSYWLSGKRVPGLIEAYKLSQALGVSMNELIKIFMR